MTIATSGGRLPTAGGGSTSATTTITTIDRPRIRSSYGDNRPAGPAPAGFPVSPRRLRAYKGAANLGAGRGPPDVLCLGCPDCTVWRLVGGRDRRALPRRRTAGAVPRHWRHGAAPAGDRRRRPAVGGRRDLVHPDRPLRLRRLARRDHAHCRRPWREGLQHAQCHRRRRSQPNGRRPGRPDRALRDRLVVFPDFVSFPDIVRGIPRVADGLSWVILLHGRQP